MAGWPDRKFSQRSCSSSSSSDSSLLDPSYAIAVDEGKEKLLTIKGEKSPAFTPTTTTTTTSSRGRSGCSLAVASLVLSLFCFLFLLFVGGSMIYVHISEARRSKEGRVCVPYDQIRPSPGGGGRGVEDGWGEGEEEEEEEDMEEHHLDEEGDSKTWCAETPSQYAHLFKLIMKRQDEAKKVAEIMGREVRDGADDNTTQTVSGGKIVSAHLLAKPNDGLRPTVQRWKSPQESPLSHVRGLILLNDTLYVSQPGVYFVYCQILYNRPPEAAGEPHTGGDPAPWVSHYVRLHSVARPASSGLLLKARHTRARGELEQDRHSSYVGGLFSLRHRDGLYVQVSLPELVSHDDRASFFGLFRVGG